MGGRQDCHEYLEAGLTRAFGSIPAFLFVVEVRSMVTSPYQKLDYKKHNPASHFGMGSVT
jgi:hypothetical protein